MISKMLKVVSTLSRMFQREEPKKETMAELHRYLFNEDMECEDDDLYLEIESRR